MHTWNWFAGVRAGAHVSISSSTELKFYHLFVFKAKKYTTNLLSFTGEEISAKHLFHWQGWVTAPPLPPTQLNPAPGQPKRQEEMKCTCPRPPLPLQLLSKTAPCSSHEPSQDQKMCQGGGYLLYLFSEKLYSKAVLPQPEESFGKAMLSKFTAGRFHTKVQSSAIHRQELKCNKTTINAHYKWTLISQIPQRKLCQSD